MPTTGDTMHSMKVLIVLLDAHVVGSEYADVCAVHQPRNLLGIDHTHVQHHVRGLHVCMSQTTMLDNHA